MRCTKHVNNREPHTPTNGCIDCWLVWMEENPGAHVTAGHILEVLRALYRDNIYGAEPDAMRDETLQAATERKRTQADAQKKAKS